MRIAQAETRKVFFKLFPNLNLNANLKYDTDKYLVHNSWNETVAEDKGYVRPFATDYANRVMGTDANMYGRPVRSEKIQVFVSDIYRSLYIEHQADVDWNGVTLRRYGLQTKDMLNAAENPENAQYYNFAPSGMENTTQAAGIPVFVSFPHFYLGDPSLVAAIKGLDPNIHRHETYIDVEPQTGLLARAEKKLQVNYLMTNYEMPKTEDDTITLAHAICANITEVEALLIASNQLDDPDSLPKFSCNSSLVTNLFTCLNAPSTWAFQNDAIYFPYGWANEQMTLPDSTADDLNDSLFLVDDLAEELRFWCLIISGLCFAVLLAMLLNSYCDQQDRRKEYLQKAFREGGVLVNNTEPLISSSSSAPPANGASFSS